MWYGQIRRQKELMSIERNEPIQFHEKGALEAVTRWIVTHHDGVVEWLKNVRRQYQVDWANVAENRRVAALLLQDARDRKPARIHWGTSRWRLRGDNSVLRSSTANCLSRCASSSEVETP